MIYSNSSVFFLISQEIKVGKNVSKKYNKQSKVGIYFRCFFMNIDSKK